MATSRKRRTWASWSQEIAEALESARLAQTPETALVASDSLRGLMDRLEDERSDDVVPEQASAVGQLSAALSQLHRFRLSKRRFCDASAEEVAEALAPQSAELFERKYLGRHIRWRVKFVGRRAGGGFVVNAGEQAEIACTLDPSVPPWTLDGLGRWEVLTLEGRVQAPGAEGKARDLRRTALALDHCLIR